MNSCVLTPMDHDAVAVHDPLGASELMATLPARNRAGDAGAIVEILRPLIPREGASRSWGFPEAAAATRDLGLLMGSLGRHGVAACSAVPELEPALLRLSEITCMPPRDTVLHYTVWNPVGPRMRRFTDLPDELALIESSRNIVRPVESAIRCLARAHELPTGSEEITALVRRACGEVAAAVSFMVDLHGRLSPEVFEHHLRPYFDPVRVGGREYIGPGGFQVPFFLLDHLLWGARLHVPWYLEYTRRMLPYAQPELRALHARHGGRPSLVDRLEREAGGAGGPAGVLAVARAALDLLNNLIRFRAPHCRLAARAHEVHVGDGEARGSGGYSMEMVRDMMDLTRQAKRRLEAIVGAAASAGHR